MSLPLKNRVKFVKSLKLEVVTYTIEVIIFKLMNKFALYFDK